MKKIIIILIFGFQFLFSTVQVNAQCSLCTKTAQQMGEKPARGLNSGILYLMVMPFAIVGVIEIIAGVLVLLRPALGAWVVMAWLIAIALVLITGGHFFDVAVRDLVMAIGAFSLAQIARAVHEENAQPAPDRRKLAFS